MLICMCTHAKDNLMQDTYLHWCALMPTCCFVQLKQQHTRFLEAGALRAALLLVSHSNEKVVITAVRLASQLLEVSQPHVSRRMLLKGCKASEQISAVRACRDAWAYVYNHTKHAGVQARRSGCRAGGPAKRQWIQGCIVLFVPVCLFVT